MEAASPFLDLFMFYSGMIFIEWTDVTGVAKMSLAVSPKIFKNSLKYWSFIEIVDLQQ